jgi:diadenosine tetraphosphate (Ap4A) HIT family hydrolase
MDFTAGPLCTFGKWYYIMPHIGRREGEHEMSVSNEKIWESERFYIERHESDIPWLILHPTKNHKEMSDLSRVLRHEICDILYIIECTMLDYYHPKKINIASFGNYLPLVHWHIMARFRDDSHFPEPMWGIRQRETKPSLPPFDLFSDKLNSALSGFRQTH